LIEVQLALVLLLNCASQIGTFLPCLTKNDPMLKIVPLYHPPMTCPLMNNHDFLSSAYIDILQNMLDRKIILSYKNLIELIAIVLHERCQRLNTQVLENIPLPIWLNKHSFSDRFQSMKFFLTKQTEQTGHYINGMNAQRNSN
ncbi:hypothetical protein T11_18474, partial [Trichinella zimbabwensis]